MAVWVVRAGQYGGEEATALANNVATVLWNDLPGLSCVHSRERLEAIYREAYPDENNAQVAQQVGQLWDFRSKIETGDLVLLPLMTMRHAFAAGLVTGPYAYRKDLGRDVRHTVPVEWFAADIRRSGLSPDLTAALGRPRTVYRIATPPDAEERFREFLSEEIGRRWRLLHGGDEGQRTDRRERRPDSAPDFVWARRVLFMTHELHKRGYQRLRIAPGMAPSGCYWRCTVTHVGNILARHGARAAVYDDHTARYTTGQEDACFGWQDARHDSPAELATKFVERFPEIAWRGVGTDWAYAGWYVQMLGLAERDVLPIAYADWYGEPDPRWLTTVPSCLPTGGGAEVRLPMPPGGEAAEDCPAVDTRRLTEEEINKLAARIWGDRMAAGRVGTTEGGSKLDRIDQEREAASADKERQQEQQG
jgi:hypothetical protein